MKNNQGGKVFNVIAYGFTIIFAIMCLIPFIMVVSGSLTDEVYLTVHGMGLWPGKFSGEAYRYVMKNAAVILNAYKVSIFVTVAGTLLSLAITTMYAYPLSRKDFKYSTQMSFIAYFTMIFQGGMVPWFIVTKNILHLSDTVWALILPYGMNVWNMFLLRNFMGTIPSSLYEAAEIDGAGEFSVFLKVMLPLSVPGLATIGMYYMIGYWNDWWLSLMLISDTKLYPLQMLLRRIIDSINYYSSGTPDTSVGTYVLPSESVKMATTIMTMGPILLVYPFIQKYFVSGLVVGGVKG